MSRIQVDDRSSIAEMSATATVAIYTCDAYSSHQSAWMQWKVKRVSKMERHKISSEARRRLPHAKSWDRRMCCRFDRASKFQG